ncbi:MAG: G/T mismatches repair enzyme [Methanoregulaceae archaeon PtaB.Bin108]|nr:MAG: G/T mismatches repair enzyme [Methanoregulaceae archaeon PtaB.Bin108]
MISIGTLNASRPLQGDESLKEHGGVIAQGAGRIREFQERVYRFYRKNGRDLPWRRTTVPYEILVSEIMLQQTQVERVCGRYERFLVRFPDFPALAGAELRDVLHEWQGLGYNRRAKSLHATAGIVMGQYEGVLPDNEKVLASLPGIGKATAASIVAFAFNRPSVVIETNIRRVFIHCFFDDQETVSDRDIAPLVAATCDRENPRAWYYALMDLGSSLKTRIPNPNRRSTMYRRQARFEGSDRMIRGRILAFLVGEDRISVPDLVSRLESDPGRVESILKTLEKEGFMKNEKGFLTLR